MKTQSEHIADILRELPRAEELHPAWPDDIVHQVAIMCEESGESLKAALNAHYFGDPVEEVRKELVQTGAMVLRCLEHLQC